MGILVNPITPLPSHPTEEILEEYVFDRLPERLVAQVEEHLLVCPSCQNAVAETDRFVSTLRVAAKSPAPVIGPVRSAWRTRLKAFPHLTQVQSPVPVLAAAVLALVVVWQHPQGSSTPVAVSLSSVRGGDLLSPAPAGKLLQLRIEAPDLAPGRAYRADIVDAAGVPVCKGALTETDGKLVATISRPLGAGRYWVRLYDAGGVLLREFGMSVK